MFKDAKFEVNCEQSCNMLWCMFMDVLLNCCPQELPEQSCINCYMFKECTSLTTAPELPATTPTLLYNMFRLCKKFDCCSRIACNNSCIGTVIIVCFMDVV